MYIGYPTIAVFNLLVVVNCSNFWKQSYETLQVTRDLMIRSHRNCQERPGGQKSFILYENQCLSAFWAVRASRERWRLLNFAEMSNDAEQLQPIRVQMSRTQEESHNWRHRLCHMSKASINFWTARGHLERNLTLPLVSVWMYHESCTEEKLKSPSTIVHWYTDY